MAEYVDANRGRVTISQLVDMARGTGKGEFSSRRNGKDKEMLLPEDRESRIGEVIELSKEVR